MISDALVAVGFMVGQDLFNLGLERLIGRYPFS